MENIARQTIAVIGSGHDEHRESASEIGRLLASLAVNLLTGGGRGVMMSVARAYTESPRSSGISIGIIPCISIDNRARPKQGYPNEFVELPIFTHLPYSGSRGKDDLSRNHINVLSCLAVVALPGGKGTAAEVELALQYGRPVIAYACSDAMPEQVERAERIEEVEKFLRRKIARGE